MVFSIQWNVCFLRSDVHFKQCSRQSSWCPSYPAWFLLLMPMPLCVASYIEKDWPAQANRMLQTWLSMTYDKRPCCFCLILFWITHFRRSQLPCCKDTQAVQRRTVHGGELRPPASCEKELFLGSYLSVLVKITATIGTFSLQFHERPWAKSTKLNCS